LREFLESRRATGGIGFAADAISTVSALAPARPALSAYTDWLVNIPSPYSWRDVARFAPSAAAYFMDGYSDARIRIRASGEEILLQFWDQNTSIAASAPKTFDSTHLAATHYTPAPPPLNSTASFPENTPKRYQEQTSYHLMQVISMNMRAKDSDARLLIGLPYAEKYPHIFYRNDLFGETRRDSTASSFGVVQSLTQFTEPGGGRTPDTNGYPARSFFAIYHLIETPVGALFNKKATQMELQPSADGKLALKLPPMPFKYSLINGPIPLYDVNSPTGEPIADVVAAHHNDAGASVTESPDAWPWHSPDVSQVKEIASRLRRE
jgi:hypothetical protein